MTSRFKNTLVIGASLAAVALASTPAFAQTTQAPVEGVDTDNSVEAIVVTGSRIQRPDLQAASPVTAISAEAIQLRNKPGVEEFLRDLPQAVPGVGSATNNGNPGVATVNLRNLGEVRTLVLVDGHRFVPFDSNGIVDLNMIPSSLVQRVDVLTGGASSTYGSDAVAGVVNFILKHNFTGIAGDAQYGITELGDGAHRDFSLTGGINLGSRGNFVVNGTYSEQEKVALGGPRAYSQFSLSPDKLTAAGGSSTNIFGSIDTGAQGRYTFTPGGFVPYSAARDSFNFNPYNLTQVPHTKWNATALLNYELTDGVEFFARGSYGDTKVQTEIAPSGTFGFGFNINYRTNPFLDPALNPASSGARAIFANIDATDATPNDGMVRVGVRRRTPDVGPRTTAYHNRAYQGIAGFRGDLSSSLHYEVFGQYGKTIRDIAYLNDLDAGKVQQALLVVQGPNGPVCINPSNGCAPANLFGQSGLSAAGAKFISFSLSEVDKNDQLVGGGFLTGDIAPIEFVAAHPAAFVLGAEYRRERATANPDNNLRTGNSIGFGSSTPLQAQIDVKEVYGELKVPLIADAPFFQELELEAGVRYSAYKNSTSVDNTGTGGVINNFKNSFNNLTFKIGGGWKPVDSIRIRAMFQRAVRAPNLSEIGLPVTPGTGDATFDPCAAGTFTSALQTLCLTVGGGFPRGVIPGTTDQPTSGQVNNFSGGNPALVPERANTITVGAVFTPTFMRGFTASVDFFDIKVKKAILSTPEQAILDACYYSEKVATGTFCSLIKRSQIDGTLEGDTIYGVDSTSRNAGLITQRGIDVAANYRTAVTDNLNLILGLNATYTIDSKVQFAPVLPIYECAGKVGKTCRDPQPKFASVANVGFELDKFLTQFTWRHTSSITQDALSVGANLQPASAFAVPVIPSYDYFDVAMRWNVAPHFQFRLAAENLFNKQPPVVGTGYGATAQNSGNTYPASYDTLGRRFSVGANVKF